MDGGDRITQAGAAALLGAVAFVSVRSLLAQRRGADAGAAATRAVQTLTPGILVVGLGLVVFLIFAAVSSVVVILALLALLTGEGNYDGAALAVLIGGTVFAVVAVAGALVWGVRRIRR